MLDADEMGAATSTKTPGVPPPALADLEYYTKLNSSWFKLCFQECSSVHALLFFFATSVLYILLQGGQCFTEMFGYWQDMTAAASTPPPLDDEWIEP